MSQSRRRQFLITSIGLLMALWLEPCVAEVYKWVDPQGNVHYSDQPPKGAPSREIEIPPAGTRAAPPPPDAPSAPSSGKSYQQLEKEFQERRLKEAEDRAREEQRAQQQRAKAPATAAYEQLPLTSSQYLLTTETWLKYEMHFDRLAGTLGLVVKARRENKDAVWLQVFFEVPLTPSHAYEVDNPYPPLMTVALPNLIRAGPGEEVRIEAPTVEYLRCRSYLVSIHVYADHTGRAALGEHSQRIYSRLNGVKIRSDTDLAEALRAPGKCLPAMPPK